MAILPYGQVNHSGKTSCNPLILKGNLWKKGGLAQELAFFMDFCYSFGNLQLLYYDKNETIHAGCALTHNGIYNHACPTT
jgi:hypothetical protein